MSGEEAPWLGKVVGWVSSLSMMTELHTMVDLAVCTLRRDESFKTCRGFFRRQGGRRVTGDNMAKVDYSA